MHRAGIAPASGPAVVMVRAVVLVLVVMMAPMLVVVFGMMMMIPKSPHTLSGCRDMREISIVPRLVLHTIDFVVYPLRRGSGGVLGRRVDGRAVRRLGRCSEEHPGA
jgi:hypothetical protein